MRSGNLQSVRSYYKHWELHNTTQFVTRGEFLGHNKFRLNNKNEKNDKDALNFELMDTRKLMPTHI